MNPINTGKRTEWSPIRSVIIRVITKSDGREAGVRFVNHEYDYRPTSNDTKSTYRPINHKHSNFREAQEIKILLGNNHVGIQDTRSLTTLKIIIYACLSLSIK